MLLFALIMLLCNFPSADGFAFRPRVASNLRATVLRAERKDALNFNVNVAYASEPLKNVAKGDVVQFFKEKTVRDLLVSVGGTRHVEELSLKPEWVKLWKDSCDYFHSKNYPDITGNVCALTCAFEVQFPGLKLVTTVLSGMKEIEGDGWPVYEMHALMDKQEAYGPEPVVWLFNQMTGNAGEREGKFHPANAKGRSVLSILEKNGGYAFSWDVKLDIEMKFPVNLLCFYL